MKRVILLAVVFASNANAATSTTHQIDPSKFDTRTSVFFCRRDDKPDATVTLGVEINPERQVLHFLDVGGKVRFYLRDAIKQIEVNNVGERPFMAFRAAGIPYYKEGLPENTQATVSFEHSMAEDGKRITKIGITFPGYSHSLINCSPMPFMGAILAPSEKPEQNNTNVVP